MRRFQTTKKKKPFKKKYLSLQKTSRRTKNYLRSSKKLILSSAPLEETEETEETDETDDTDEDETRKGLDKLPLKDGRFLSALTFREASRGSS